MIGWGGGVVIVSTLLLAFFNGANDNAKGVASVIGARLLSTRAAIAYAGATTLLGSVAAIGLAGELVSKFKGRDIVGDALLTDSAFAGCIGLAAGGTVLLATRMAMPISTTHAMVGSIMGIGLAHQSLNWSAVWSKFFQPLLIAPVLAMALALVLYLLLRSARQAAGVTHQTCLCVDGWEEPVHVTPEGSLVLQRTGVRITADDAERCRQRYDGQVLGLEVQRMVNGAHLVSAGALSFSRGLNDTPKIAALLIAVDLLARPGSLALTGVAIGAGGVLMVGRVARTMSWRITEMNEGQAFCANLVAATLVTTASLHGLPVSTTHVSCGSLFGIGVAGRAAHWGMIGRIVLAWVTTLPVAAAIGYGVWIWLG